MKLLILKEKVTQKKQLISELSKWWIYLEIKALTQIKKLALKSAEAYLESIWESKMELFYKNSLWLSAINYFH